MTGLREMSLNSTLWLRKSVPHYWKPSGSQHSQQCKLLEKLVVKCSQKTCLRLLDTTLLAADTGNIRGVYDGVKKAIGRGGWSIVRQGEYHLRRHTLMEVLDETPSLGQNHRWPVLRKGADFINWLTGYI